MKNFKPQSNEVYVPMSQEERTAPPDDDPRWAVLKELEQKERDAHMYLKAAQARFEKAEEDARRYRLEHYLYADDE